MNPKIEEMKANAVPTKNKINPIPYAAPSVSPILLIQANEINTKIPEKSKVPIDYFFIIFHAFNLSFRIQDS